MPHQLWYLNYHPISDTISYLSHQVTISMVGLNTLLSYPIIEGVFYGLTLGFKTCIMIFVFIWTRASLPRIRFDQLMSFCWTILLPLVISFIIAIPCVIHGFETIATNVFLL
jgi:NADH-ubiquinone oxidoreductase chain 1